MSTNHITVEVRSGRVQVVADDYELFDLVDDLVTDNDLEYEYTTEEQRGGRTHYLMHFPPDVSAERVSEVVAGIPGEEIRRVWSLNNPQ